MKDSDTRERFRTYGQSPIQSKRLLTPASLIWPPEVENAIKRSVRGHVLDIGTGNGVKLQRVLEICGSQVETVVAIEPSPLVAQAERNLSPLGVRIKECSLFDYEPDDRFDTILMLEVIEHMPDSVARTSLDLVVKLLHISGIFVCSTPNKWPHYLCERLASREDDETHINVMSYFAFRRLMESRFRRVAFVGVLPIMRIARRVPILMRWHHFISVPVIAKSLCCFASDPH